MGHNEFSLWAGKSVNRCKIWRLSLGEGISKSPGQSIRSREGERPLLSTLKASRSESVEVGQGGGDRKTVKENIVSLKQREDSLKEGCGHPCPLLSGRPPPTLHKASWERAASCPEGKARRTKLWISVIIFNLLEDFLSVQQHFLPETKLEAWDLGVAPADLIAE